MGNSHKGGPLWFELISDCSDFCLFSWFQSESRKKVFAEKLETLLHWAYYLQEDFGTTIPPDSLLTDFGN